MKRFRWYGCWLVFLLFAGLNMAQAAGTNRWFAQGVKAYQAGQYVVAAQAFEKSAQQQPAAGTFLNLGLADWRSGDSGAAMLAWERACWLNPFDSQATGNLHLARQTLQLDSPDLKWYETASTWLPPDAWVWLAGVSLWLAVGLITLPGFLRWRKAGWHQSVAAVACGVFLFAMVANLGVISRTHIGLVMHDDAPLLLTPTTGGEVVTTLSVGEPAREVRVHGDYVLVQTADGEGWLAQKNLNLICPN